KPACSGLVAIGRIPNVPKSQIWNVARGRTDIIRQGPTEELALRIVIYALHRCRSEPVGKTTTYLAFQQGGINDAAHVVHSDVAIHCDPASVATTATSRDDAHQRGRQRPGYPPFAIRWQQASRSKDTSLTKAACFALGKLRGVPVCPRREAFKADVDIAPGDPRSAPAQFNL